jgi:hypothetical protein
MVHFAVDFVFSTLTPAAAAGVLQTIDLVLSLCASPKSAILRYKRRPR